MEQFVSEETQVDVSPVRKVAWERVALFYGVSFGMVALLTVGLYFAGARMDVGNAAVVFQLTVAFLYMPMPLVAGLIVERVAHRRMLVRDVWSQIKSRTGQIVLVAVGTGAAVYASYLLVTFVFGNLLMIPGVGTLVFTTAGLVRNLASLLPPEAAVDPSELANVPPVGAMYALGAVAGVIAGFTINGLFAFGEEYGWRGVLMDELSPLGPLRANLLTGVLWGLWHAPLILLGFNYGAQRWLGVLMMCVWVTPFSFILWRSRELSGSVVTPAIIHGAFNASAGFFLLLVAQRNTLIAVPVGLAAAVALTGVAALMWRIDPGVLHAASAPHAVESR